MARVPEFQGGAGRLNTLCAYPEAPEPRNALRMYPSSIEDVSWPRQPLAQSLEDPTPSALAVPDPIPNRAGAFRATPASAGARRDTIIKAGESRVCLGWTIPRRLP